MQKASFSAAAVSMYKNVVESSEGSSVIEESLLFDWLHLPKYWQTIWCVIIEQSAT
ncbi:MAG: hypothetical protein Q8M16_18165 [Pirellulaceae bacterium]|nr:hypothetical protein [Pirellulaceae bacterium]